MTRVLRQPSLDQTPRPLIAQDLAADPAVQALVAAAADQARAEGLAAGRLAVAAEASAKQDRLAAMVRSAMETSLAEANAGRAGRAAETVALAVRIARELVGVSLTEDALDLAERIRAALARMDDHDLVVRVHPQQAMELERRLRELTGLTIEGDPALQLGEATVIGPWSDADLRWDTIWALVEDALGTPGASGVDDDPTTVVDVPPEADG